jgi:hypothetical protein
VEINDNIDENMIDLISDEMYNEGLSPDVIEALVDLSKEDDEAFELMLKWQRFKENRLDLENKIWELLRRSAKI